MYTHYISIYTIYIQILHLPGDFFFSPMVPDGPQRFEEWTHLAWEFHLFSLEKLLMAEILAPFGMCKTRRSKSWDFRNQPQLVSLPDFWTINRVVSTGFLYISSILRYIIPHPYVYIYMSSSKWNWHSFTNVIWESWERWKMLLGTWLLKSKVVKVVRAMVSLGSTVFFICKGKEGKVKLRGTVVDTANQTLVVAIDAPQAGQIANSVLYQKAGEDSIGFVRVAASAVSSVEPAGWDGIGGSTPKFSKSLVAWESLESKVGLDSSETEKAPVEGRKGSEPFQRKLEQDLLRMSQELWTGGGSGSDDSSSESDVGAEVSRPAKHLAPGASSKGRVKKDKADKQDGDLQQDFQKVLMQSSCPWWWWAWCWISRVFLERKRKSEDLKKTISMVRLRQKIQAEKTSTGTLEWNQWWHSIGYIVEFIVTLERSSRSSNANWWKI